MTSGLSTPVLSTDPLPPNTPTVLPEWMGSITVYIGASELEQVYWSKFIGASLLEQVYWSECIGAMKQVHLHIRAKISNNELSMHLLQFFTVRHDNKYAA